MHDDSHYHDVAAVQCGYEKQVYSCTARMWPRMVKSVDCSIIAVLSLVLVPFTLSLSLFLVFSISILSLFQPHQHHRDDHRLKNFINAYASLDPDVSSIPIYFYSYCIRFSSIRGLDPLTCGPCTMMMNEILIGITEK